MHATIARRRPAAGCYIRAGPVVQMNAAQRECVRVEGGRPDKSCRLAAFPSFLAAHAHRCGHLSSFFGDRQTNNHSIFILKRRVKTVKHRFVSRACGDKSGPACQSACLPAWTVVGASGIVVLHHTTHTSPASLRSPRTDRPKEGSDCKMIRIKTYE